MRPRGLRVPWRRATATYWYEPRQPARAAELREALAIETGGTGQTIAAVAPSCPRCGSRVVYDLTCHTYPQRRDDGTERFMACLPCDSAIRYMCDGPDSGEGYPDEGCGWEYTHGLNPRNPRAAANEASRPPWLPGKFDEIPAPGCRMFGKGAA